MGAAKEKPSQIIDEKEIIYQVLVVCAAIMSVAVREYTPEQLGEKLILLGSRRTNSLIHLLVNAVNKTNGQLYRPEELNKEQGEQLLDTELYGMTKERKYLGSSHMTENLKVLQFLGVYENITNKREIRRQEKGKARNERGGRLSRYKLAANIEQIKSVMANQEACTLLKELLSRLRIYSEFQKHMLLALFYAVKKDKNIAQTWLKLLPRQFIDGLDLTTFIERLSSVEESQFLNFVSAAIQPIIDNQKFDNWFIIKLFFPFL